MIVRFGTFFRNIFKMNYSLWSGLVMGILIAVVLKTLSCVNNTGSPIPAPPTWAPREDYQPLLREVGKRGTGQGGPGQGSPSVQRPRYYSTELGIRDKLFVAVMTEEARLATMATAVNRSLAHLTAKIKFFMSASSVKGDLALPNVIGFTDTRQVLKPFHVLKYVCDNWLDEFEFLFLVSDAGFVDGRSLVELVSHISVSQDVYAGTRPDADSHYCILDAGMLLSNSVVRKIKDNLDWCVRNCYSDEYYENIGRCITHSTNLKCSDTIQGHKLTSYKLPENWDLQRDFKAVMESDANFNKAITVFPIVNYKDFYAFQMYFSKLHLESIHSEISKLKKSVKASISNMANDVETGVWGAGFREDPTLLASKPPDRFHQPRLSVFNQNYSLMPDDYTNILNHTDAEKKDINYVIEEAVLFVRNKNPQFTYKSLINGYKRFDPSRGLLYILDLSFYDNQSGNTIVKRMEIMKSLGRASLLPVPYVTESVRIVLILPIWQNEANVGAEFINHYEQMCMLRKDKVYLLLVLIYSINAPSKGSEDKFNNVKTMSLDLSQKYKADSLKIGWVSVRLPAEIPETVDIDMFNIALIDLALRKVPPESLVLIGNPHMEMRPDFLNRVRMNTIQSYQIFSPIGFQHYHPMLSTGPSPSKGAGRFAPWNYNIISFYSKDYVAVRKSIQNEIPITRTDKDIESVLATGGSELSIFSLFVKYSQDIHAFRAAEPGLFFKYNPLNLCRSYKNLIGDSSSFTNGENDKVYFENITLTSQCFDTLSKSGFASTAIGSRSQLAKAIFESNM